MEKYRSPESLKEIYSLFEREECEGAFIWQNKGVGIRNQIPVNRLELNRSSEIIYLSLAREFDFDPSYPIYIYHPFRKTVSKTEYLGHFAGELSVNLPKDIKTLDTRNAPRFKFKPSDEKFVTLKFDSKIASLASRELKFQLIDISQSGIAICVSHKNKELFNFSQNFILTHLGKIPLPKPLSISEVYLKPFTYKTRGKRVNTNRAGFQIQGALKKFVLNAFADQEY